MDRRSWAVMLAGFAVAAIIVIGSGCIAMRYLALVNGENSVASAPAALPSPAASSAPSPLTPPTPTPEPYSDDPDPEFKGLAEGRWTAFQAGAARIGVMYQLDGRTLNIFYDEPGREQDWAERVGRWLGRSISVRVWNVRREMVGHSLAPRNPAYPWTEPEPFAAHQ